MHTNLPRLKRGRNLFARSAVLTGSLGLTLLPLLANAQINRSRPPTPPSSGSSNNSSSNSGKSGGSSSSSSSNNSGSSGRSGNSGSSSSSSGSGSSGQSSGNRTPPGSGGRSESSSGSSGSSARNNPVTGGRSGNSSGGNSGSNPVGGSSPIRNNPAGQRSSNSFSNPVHSYTSPLSPFAYNPNSGTGNRSRGQRTGPYSGPLSPFMTYQPPTNPRRNYPTGFDRFNQSRESFHYRYRNGLFGRTTTCYYPGWGDVYFPGGTAFFPYYYPRYVAGITTLSPYAYYFDLFPAYMNLNVGFYSPPQYVYVPVPVYQDGLYSGWRRDDIDDYYLNREASRLRDEENRLRDREKDLDARERALRDREARAWQKDRYLTIAIDNITHAWTDKDIQLLSKHVRKDVNIAVYLRGKYQYSLDATDYLDMTRDAFRAAQTLKFKLDKVERKEDNIYLVTGRHTYKDKEGNERNVLVSYVLEKINDEYMITQVGTAPERLEEPKDIKE